MDLFFLNLKYLSVNIKGNVKLYYNHRNTFFNLKDNSFELKSDMENNLQKTNLTITHTVIELPIVPLLTRG